MDGNVERSKETINIRLRYGKHRRNLNAPRGEGNESSSDAPSIPVIENSCPVGFVFILRYVTMSGLKRVLLELTWDVSLA
jgi:hypothetical protein